MRNMFHPFFRKGEAGLGGFIPPHRATGKAMGLPRKQSRMKRFGKVDIPADAFTVMLKRD